MTQSLEPQSIEELQPDADSGYSAFVIASKADGRQFAIEGVGPFIQPQGETAKALGEELMTFRFTAPCDCTFIACEFSKDGEILSLMEDFKKQVKSGETITAMGVAKLDAGEKIA